MERPSFQRAIAAERAVSGDKPSGDGRDGQGVQARAAKAIDFRDEHCRGPCGVHDRLLLGNTTSLRLRVWDIACTSTAVEHSARSSMRSMMQLCDSSYSVWQYRRTCRLLSAAMLDDAARDGHVHGSEKERVQTAGDTLSLVYLLILTGMQTQGAGAPSYLQDAAG